MLANKFYTCLAAESAAARDGAEALGSSRREFNGRREFQIDYIFGRSGEGLQIRSLSDDRFGKALFRMSSLLPPHAIEAAAGKGYDVRPGARGFVYNAGIEAVADFFDIGTRPSVAADR